MDPTIETSLARIQTDPASGVVTAFFEEKTTIGNQVFLSPWTQVSWSLTDASKSVTVNGIELTYAQVSAAVVAIAYAERAASLVPPAPVVPEVAPEVVPE